MARRSRSPLSSSHAPAPGRGQRGYPHPIANLGLLDLSRVLVSPPRTLSPEGDRRRFYPDTGVMRKEFRRPSIPVSSRVDVRRLVISPFGPLKQAVRFAVPKRVRLCVKRKERREVLLAKGKGGGNHRKPRRTEYSSVRC